MLLELCEAGLMPDPLVRQGVRRISAARLEDEFAHDPSLITRRKAELLAQWQTGPIAIETKTANEQHYELPPEFFQLILGKNLKYSCGLWPSEVSNLDESEAAMLKLSCERAEIEDGMTILDLGCGWGSMSLWMARHYPQSKIFAISNSSAQREFIEAQAQAQGLNNLRVQTSDINGFNPKQKFDRVVSIEMMEHVRNHRLLFQRIAGWLTRGGKLFSHVFCHRELLYPYEIKNENDWMTRYFFSGGIMPSSDLFLHCQQHLMMQQQWWVAGTQYAATSNAWLKRMDQNRDQIRTILRKHYSATEARRWQNRWRMFFMAVAEFFNYDQGRQWGVGHYLMHRR